MAIGASSSLTPGKPPINALENSLLSSPQDGTTEKTKTWAGLFFRIAIVLAAAATYYVYRAWRDRRPSLLIPALLWALVAMIIGTIGEILHKKPKAEAPAEIKQAPSAAFVKGQPVPIQNAGNTCFINAPTQGIMNDQQYPRIFKIICEQGKARHETFAAFLSLFASPSLFSNFFRTRDAAPPLEGRNARDVLVMLSQKKSSLGYGTPEFSTNYPRLFALLGQFAATKKEEAFPAVAENDAVLNAEFAKMKKDQRIMKFFSEERVNVAKTLQGFDAYLALIKSYEAASSGEPHNASSIGNVRNLMRGADNNSQEDVEEFLHCLTQYVRADDFPEAFVPISHEQEWVECDAKYQDAEKIKQLFEKHKNSKSPDDKLTELPDNLITRSPAQPYCIFTIKDVPTENAYGQILLDQSLNIRDTLSDQQHSAAVYLKGGEPKMYYPRREQWLIEKPPERFILQLKRFKWVKGQRQKVDCNVNMPEEIAMRGQQYELQSVVVHTGSADGGHYHAMVKRTTSELTKWWYASDSQIESESIDTAVETALKRGYLYFYVKKAPAGV